jgi:hypothetical protein
MYEDGGDVDTVGTGHTVFTVVARDVFQTHNALGDILVQVALFFLG